MKLVNAEQMRNLDRTAIDDYGIHSAVLMENAGRGAVDAMERHFGSLAGLTVAIVAGPGNNGGDGLVMARHLHQRGAKPGVLLLVDPSKLSGDAAMNYGVVAKLPIPVVAALDEKTVVAVASRMLHGSRIVVDAIFGTGLKREVQGHFARAVEYINDCSRPVVAVDLPSGLDSDNGRTLGICVRAQLTVTFGLAKTGMSGYPGADFCGQLEIVDIGIPHEAVAEANINTELLDWKQVYPLLPARQVDSHKGTFGHLLIVAGSRGKTGAAILAGRGGLRSGAGLVTLCMPDWSQFAQAPPELMTLPLADSAECFGPENLDVIMGALAGKKALVLGPGISTDQRTEELVYELWRRVELPMVVDADALNIMAGQGLKIKPGGPRILTPHPGEMARLTGQSSFEVQQNRLQISADFASRHGLVTVLKGARTIIAGPDGRVGVNPTGNPCMAAGGMGDVLAGLIGGLLAQGMPSWEAACLGVYVHGLAADQLVARWEVTMGVLASEVADNLPRAFRQLETGNDACDYNI